MDKRILDIVSNQLLTKKVQAELELEKLINNQYNISVDKLTERVVDSVTELGSVVHTIRMWEDIINQITPKTPPEEEGK